MSSIESKHQAQFNPAHPQFRRKVCRHYLRGRCDRGEHCNFRHDEVDDAVLTTHVITNGKPASPKSASPTMKKYLSLSDDYVVVEPPPVAVVTVETVSSST